MPRLHIKWLYVSRWTSSLDSGLTRGGGVVLDSWFRNGLGMISAITNKCHSNRLQIPQTGNYFSLENVFNMHALVIALLGNQGAIEPAQLAVRESC